MRVVFCEKYSRKLPDAVDLYVLSDRVRPGQILHVQNCFAHAPDRDANELVRLGVRSGGQDVLVRVRGGAIAKEGMSSLNPFLVGEGDVVFAYFPSATTGDTIELHINGILMSLDEWRAAGA